MYRIPPFQLLVSTHDECSSPLAAETNYKEKHVTWLLYAKMLSQVAFDSSQYLLAICCFSCFISFCTTQWQTLCSSCILSSVKFSSESKLQYLKTHFTAFVFVDFPYVHVFLLITINKMSCRHNFDETTSGLGLSLDY